MERVCGRLWKGRLPASLRVGQSPRSYAAVRPKETVRLSLDPSGNGRNHQCRHISVASFGGFGRNASPSFPNPHRLPIHRRPRLPSQRHFSSVFSTSPGEFSATEHRATRGTAEKNTQRELQRNHAAVATIPPKLRSEVEVAVRRRLHETFPEAFGVIRNNSSSSSSSSSNHRTGGTRGTERTMLLSSVRTLLDLNGFQKVVTPSGTKSRLYLAEGVVATPPRWNFRSSPSVAKAEAEAKAPSPPFPDGDEHTVPVQNNNSSSSSSSSSRLGIFAEMNHRLMAYQQSSARDRLFALPVAVSRLHPDDDASSLGYGTGAAAKSATAAAGRQQPSFPEFVQDDITVYRMAENSAARFLDRRYSSWKDWTEKRFVLPLRNARYRTRVMMKAVQKARRNVNAVLEKSVMERVLDAVRGDTSTSSISSSSSSISSSAAKPQSVLTNETKGTDESKEAGNTLASSPAEQDSFHETDPSSNGDGDTGTGTGSVDDDIREEPLETLMVVSSQPTPKSKSSSKPRHSSTAPTPTHRRRRRDDGYDNEDDDKDDDDDDEIVVSATLYRRMTPSTRILALPDYYVLRHSSASTLVSVSLVVFGALPMAYRSYVFTIDYDWLVDSSVIASSVVGTVLYYLYAARYKARTSQSNTVHRALYSRVYARDDAALMALKEGAFRTVSGAVLREIAIANNGNNKSSNNNDDNNDDNNKSNNNDDNNNGNNGNDEFEFECDGPRSTGVPAASVVDPREWAIDLGFVLVPSSPPTPGRTRTSTSDDDDETNGADSAVPTPGSDGKRYNT